jgi:hypothetical protein
MPRLPTPYVLVRAAGPFGILTARAVHLR